MTKTTKTAILAIFAALAFVAALATPSALAVVGEDDRFYVHNSKWSELFSGVVKLPGCTGFLLEGDVIATAAHCLSGDESSLIKEDGAIDFERVKKMRIQFGDFESQSFDTRSKIYTVKDVFLGTNFNQCPSVLGKDLTINDFAFIKLNEDIPNNIKRFKLLKNLDLKEYDILDNNQSRGLSVSTVGYPGDNDKTQSQRSAHVACRLRDMKNHKEVSLLYTDCDITRGASGSPLFKILKHKKTGEIALGLLGVLNKEFKSSTGRAHNEAQTSYHMGFGFQYRLSNFCSNHSSTFVSVNNHSLFLDTLEDFIKDSSQFRFRKTQPVKKHEWLDEDLLLSKINTHGDAEFKDLLDRSGYDMFLQYRSCQYNSLALLNSLKKLNNEKETIVANFIDRYKNTYDKSCESEKRIKQFSEKNIKTVYGKNYYDLHKNDLKDVPIEDSNEDKELSDRLWHDYFGE